MLTFLSNLTTLHRKCTPESIIMAEEGNDYTITNQEEIRKKLNYMFSKNILLSITVPEKSAASALLTTITYIEGGYIYFGGFQKERFNQDLLMQTMLVVTADFEGIAVNFMISDLSGQDIDGTFNLKAPIPQTIEWLKRRNARRVKVPINVPVKVQYKGRAECFNVADISVTGLSYIDQTEDNRFAVVDKLGKVQTDCNIIMPDKSVYVACFEIVNNITMPCTNNKQINRVGCEIKRASYRLDTALQHLINQIDFYYQ